MSKEIPAYLVALAVLVAIVVFTMSGHGVPTVLWAILGATVGGGLGITIPGLPTTSSSAVTAATSNVTSYVRPVAAPATGAQVAAAAEPTVLRSAP